MGIITVIDEFTSPISAQRMFKAFILDGDNLIPKIAPQAIKNVEKIHGDGGPGSIMQMNFAEGSEIKYLKKRIDALNKKNMNYAYTLIESNIMMDKFESISHEIKLESTPDGGCKSKNTSNYHTKPGVEIKEEEIKASKERAALFVKTIEDYLLANPNEYV